MSYKAIVTALKNVRPHTNADRVKLATCHGNQVVVSLNSEEGELGIYFPSDGQLSHEFCHYNNLYRESSQNFDTTKTGMFDSNRRVRAQRFRGEISDGFWVPLSNFDFLKTKINWIEGFEFTELNSVQICDKYVNPATAKIAREKTKGSKNAKTSIMFKEHFDTEHFGKYISVFEENDTIIITEKLHGTSGRIGNVLVDRNLTWSEKLLKRLGVKIQETEWKYLNGTRRVVLEESTGTQFHDPTIRDKAFSIFNGNLRKGETVYFEIVGYESTGATIMPSVNTEKLGDKEFTKTYGKTMSFTYGTIPTNCEIYVYRMTKTNEDGQTIDYSWDDVVKRCHEIGVKNVPFISKTTLREIDMAVKMKTGNPSFAYNDSDAKNELERLVTLYGSGPSTLDSGHIKEGVCVRIEGGINNRTFKFKSFEFKILEGIIKDSGIIDTEEAQG